ncbi:TrmB family transcriptional regulator [Methanofollis fontis]|uniref:TrmB family transcriptional regulator n=2 Tax=Methanofollis fontis TaxID=2052832 RepID=A0A483CQR8_9EURY|nr:TrmB family transcriptional regulator [Methanofollis fontis]
MPDDLLPLLRNLGLNDYEGRVYSTLLSLRKATARDIHELSGVPRGRIYDILHDLARRGFIGIEEGSPTCYYLLDPDDVIDHIKEEYLSSLEQTRKAIRNLSVAHLRPPPSFYMLRSDWAIANHLTSMFKRVRNRMVILCNDPSFLRSYMDELRAVSKRADLYIVVRDAEAFAAVDLPVYEGSGALSELLSLHKGPDRKSFGTAIFMDDGDFFALSVPGSDGGAFTGSDAPMMRFLLQSIIMHLEAEYDLPPGGISPS